MTGEDIEMTMRTMVTDVKKASYESSFLGQGHFFDETEIEKEYKDRPEQKKTTFDNALKMWHPDRQCQAWRIRDLTTAELTKESKERTLKLEGEGIDTCKNTKVAEI